MALDINRSLVERTWILPRIKELTAIARKYDKTQPVSFALEAIGNFSLLVMQSGSGQRTDISLGDPRFDRFPLIVGRLYPTFFRSVFSPLNSGNFIDAQEILQRLDRPVRKGAKKKTAGSNEGALRLTKADDEWIATTAVGKHFELFRVALIAIGRHVEKSVKDAESSGKTLVLLK
jgi:hypothetical protein